VDRILVWPRLAAQPCAIGHLIPTSSLACCILALALCERYIGNIPTAYPWQQARQHREVEDVRMEELSSHPPTTPHMCLR